MHMHILLLALIYQHFHMLFLNIGGELTFAVGCLHDTWNTTICSRCWLAVTLTRSHYRDQKRCKTLQTCWARTLIKYCEGNQVSLFILRFYLARMAKSIAKHGGGWGAEFYLATLTYLVVLYTHVVLWWNSSTRHKERGNHVPSTSFILLYHWIKFISAALGPSRSPRIIPFRRDPNCPIHIISPSHPPFAVITCGKTSSILYGNLEELCLIYILVCLESDYYTVFTETCSCGENMR